MSMFLYQRFRDFLKVFLSAPFAALLAAVLAFVGSSMAGLPDLPDYGFGTIFSVIAGFFGLGVVLGIAVRLKRGAYPG